MDHLPTHDFSFLELVNFLLKRWRVAVALPFTSALLTALLVLIVPPTYTATSSFVPEARTQGRLPSSLAGLAGQFGIPLGMQPTESPQFYADVAKSRELLERV